MTHKQLIRFLILFQISIIFVKCSVKQNNQNETMRNEPVPAPGKWEKLNVSVDTGLRGLHTVDENIVWVSGSKGTILRSIDGGVTWDKDTIPGTKELDFRDVHGFDANKAIVLTAGQPAKIFKTNNGGVTWKEVYANLKEGVFFDAMDFWDEQNGIAFSDPINGHLLIIITKDGGETWEEVNIENIPETLEGEAGFAASGTCLTVQGESNAWIGLGGMAARVFYSTDRGMTWKVSETPILNGKASTGIFSLAFRDEWNGIAVGGDYSADTVKSANAAYTTDGGKTWTLIDESNPNGYKSCVDYVDQSGQKLIAVGTSGSDYSLDGGKTWHFMDTIAYNSVSFSGNGKTGFAVGPMGVIAKFINKN